jgi:uncharacterized membrane protein
MEEWLVYLSEKAVVVINAIALVVIVYGTLDAFISAVKIAVGGPVTDERRSLVWLNFGRWLVAGLSFQLAADIIESSVSPNWEEIGRFAAIAVIRTFLNFFINRDMEELRQRQKEETGRSLHGLATEKG